MVSSRTIQSEIARMRKALARGRRAQKTLNRRDAETRRRQGEEINIHEGHEGHEECKKALCYLPSFVLFVLFVTFVDKNILSVSSLRLRVSAVQKSSRQNTPSLACLLLIALVLMTGCDQSASAPAVRPTVPAGTCVVRGVVRFAGPAPVAKIIGGDCCPGSTPVVDESLVVGSDGALKNVVVFIKSGPNIAVPGLKDKVLAQKNCRYEPHVLAILTGQNLVVTSHDATLHNVHVEPENSAQQNFSQTLDATRSVHFDQPELVRFKCDVHPWMTAYVQVFDHPCFAVTGDDGRFEIGNLPAGTYTLVAWQEKLLTQEMSVTVTADKPVEVKFEYRP
jgi:plastocyanin